MDFVQYQARAGQEASVWERESVWELESAWESPKSIEQEMNIQELQERVRGKVFSFYRIVCAQSYYIAIIRQVIDKVRKGSDMKGQS